MTDPIKRESDEGQNTDHPDLEIASSACQEHRIMISGGLAWISAFVYLGLWTPYIWSIGTTLTPLYLARDQQEPVVFTSEQVGTFSNHLSVAAVTGLLDTVVALIHTLITLVALVFCLIRPTKQKSKNENIINEENQLLLDYEKPANPTASGIVRKGLVSSAASGVATILGAVSTVMIFRGNQKVSLIEADTSVTLDTLNTIHSYLIGALIIGFIAGTLMFVSEMLLTSNVISVDKEKEENANVYRSPR